jgi:phospholipase C
VLAEQMTAPFNAPGPHAVPAMDGFVADYISAFTAEMGRQPTYEEYAQIMTGYTPEQVPVISAIARGFAAFDHWHCDVPSQTFTNRSFYHAASASGLVVNGPPYDIFPLRNDAETIFERGPHPHPGRVRLHRPADRHHQRLPQQLFAARGRWPLRAPRP